jgi:hypothetical protein
MFPKKGNELHRGSQRSGARGEFEQKIALALRSELGSTHQSIKTVMRWTGASERTVKHWFAGTHGPNGQHLVELVRHSDAVLICFLSAANRPQLSLGSHLIDMRTKLLDLVEMIDMCDDG